MRVAVLADIHANLAALLAVLEHAKKQGAERFWCLGDIVGYAADPCACVDLIREHASLCIGGNHDLGAVGRVNPEEFNATAAIALRWTASQLSDGQQAFLSALPSKLEGEGATFAHASPRDPVWEYVLSSDVAEENFREFSTRLCFVGHSHIPFVCMEPAAGTPTQFSDYPTPAGRAMLPPSRAIINPGSVGQPRDRDPRASYLVYDTLRQSLHNHRVPYDIEATQDKIRRAGLPTRLAERLGEGS